MFGLALVRAFSDILDRLKERRKSREEHHKQVFEEIRTKVTLVANACEEWAEHSFVIADVLNRLNESSYKRSDVLALFIKELTEVEEEGEDIFKLLESLRDSLRDYYGPHKRDLEIVDKKFTEKFANKYNTLCEAVKAAREDVQNLAEVINSWEFLIDEWWWKQGIVYKKRKKTVDDSVEKLKKAAEDVRKSFWHVRRSGLTNFDSEVKRTTGIGMGRRLQEKLCQLKTTDLHTSTAIAVVKEKCSYARPGTTSRTADADETVR